MSTAGAATASDVPAAGSRLSLLGRFTLQHDGRVVRLRTRKEEGLLAYLALHPGSHPREVLAELYWGDTPEEQAKGSLRAALADLRAALDPDVLFSDRVAVQFCPPPGFRVDVLEFRTEATRYLSTPALDPAAFDPALYTGELLAGHYDDWVLAERERLRQLYLDALLHRVGRLRDLARYGEAITAARQVLAADPAEERAHQHLIYLYAVTGNRPAALRQLEVCRRSLKAELDVEPSAETLALLDAIPSAPLAAPPPAAAAAPVTASTNNLPIPLTSFVGRERELADVSRLLRMDGSHIGACRLVTLTGAGGSGKTRLALEVARLLTPKYRHGAWWVDLSSLRDPALVPDTALSALGVAPASGHPPQQTLIDYLRGRTVLLLLDNCEHLAEACARLTEAILPACSGVQILATSRQPLGVPGEQLWPVPTFSLPDAAAECDAECLLSYDAVRLFVERARLQRPTFSLEGHDAGHVAEICRRLDGIPLAIELAAARVRSMDVGEILARLQKRLRLLAAGSRLAPPRQQTLRASIDWSYNLLSPAEYLLLERLAVFVGGFTIPMAEMICSGEELAEEDVLDLLGRLVDRSLVVAEAGRYRLLETIREYALERLVDAGRAEALGERHAAYFTAFLYERRNRIQSSEQVRVIGEITTEMGNIRAAWDWAVAARRCDLLRCANLALIWYGELHSWFHEGEAMFARAVEALESGPAEDPGLVALLRAVHGHFLGRLGRLAGARQELEQGCARLRALGSPADLGTGLTLLGLAVWQEGDYPLARAILEEALRLNRDVDDRGLTGLCLFFMGLVEQTTGNVAPADACFREALAMGRDSGHPRLIAITAVHSIPTLLALGRPAQATEWLQEGLALARTTQDHWLEFAALGYLGRILAAQRDYAGAKTALQEALAVAQEIGNRHDLAWGEVGLADVTLASGDVAQADRHYRSALQLAMDSAAFPKALHALAGLAQVKALTGNREEALELARQVLVHPASTDDTRTRAAEVLRQLGGDSDSGAVTGTFEELVQGILAGNESPSGPREGLAETPFVNSNRAV